METRKNVVMEGDQTGLELLEESLRVLDSAVTRVTVEFERFDPGLKKRRETDNQIVRDAATAQNE